MKTSNKLLLGALIVLLIGLVTVNFFIHKEVQKLRINQRMELNDSTQIDTIRNSINIQIH